MPIVTVTLPSDNTTADVADYNDPITAILAVLNGGIDATNIDPNIALVSPTFTTPKILTSINDTNGAKSIGISATASAVNYLRSINAVTTAAPTWTVDGTDTNINMNLKGKGTGSVQINGTDIFEGYDYVVSGCKWTADAAGSTRAASATSGVVVIGGNPLTVAAVTARTFAASKDAYVRLLDNGDGTAVYSYDETVANNGASPSLPAGYMLVAIIPTGASSIAAQSDINQGQPNATKPITSSVAYAVTDSNGNLIYNRERKPKIIGYRKGGSGGSAGQTSVSGVVPCPVIIPDGRNIKATGTMTFGNFNTSQNSTSLVGVVEDATTTIANGTSWINGGTAASNSTKPIAVDLYRPTAGLHTYTLSASFGGGFQMSAYSEAMVMIELA